MRLTMTSAGLINHTVKVKLAAHLSATLALTFECEVLIAMPLVLSQEF